MPSYHRVTSSTQQVILAKKGEYYEARSCAIPFPRPCPRLKERSKTKMSKPKTKINKANEKQKTNEEDKIQSLAKSASALKHFEKKFR